MQLPSGLSLNPFAKIEFWGSGSDAQFTVSAPIRGSALTSHVVGSQNLPAAHAFLVASLVSKQTDIEVDQRSLDQLCSIGLFAPIDRLPTAVSYPFPLAPAMAAGEPSSSLSIGPLPESLSVPEEWQNLPLTYLQHTVGGLLAPALQAEDAAPFAVTGAAVTMDTSETRAHFEREGFAILQDLLPAEHVSALGAYFQALAREGYLERHDDRGTHRHIAHNHPVANFWHDQLTARVSHLVGQETKPTYTYVSLYIEGGDLEWHTDRPPCEYTITLLLDYAPLRDDGRSPWALKVQGRDGTIHEIHQRPGEALIFKGRELQHSREALPVGHRSASLLFHFVNADYQGIMV